MEHKTQDELLDKAVENNNIKSLLPAVRLSATTAMSQWGDQEYHRGLEAVDLFETVRKVSCVIKDDRSQYRVLTSATEELGELAQEIRVANGHSYKEEGKDGVVGEAIDLIACALDLIYITDPNISGFEINQKLALKCAKWLKNTPEQYIVE